MAIIPKITRGKLTYTLQCDMDDNCTEDVTYLDHSGFAYCTDHGKQRQRYRHCRKLRPHELNKLRRGEQLAHY